jgi:transposase
MEILYERCCGLDVHKKSIVACLILPSANGKTRKEIRSFGTMTGDLLQLADWLSAANCTHVAMESTGVYWKPIYNILEGGFELLLVNAQHIKAVPGRKTDVKDCEWIADLLRHGLLKASYVPDQGQRELRELTRYRTSLVRERAAEINRLQKTLEGANIKLAAVASSVLGVSAREMLDALVEGCDDVEALAEMARGALRGKIPQLQRALEGHFKGHQKFMVSEQLGHIDYLDLAIERVSKEVEERLRPFQREIELLDTIPGVSRRTAEVLLAELGTDMSRFATAAHLSSWAGMCPGNTQSAGKRGSGKTTKGSPWLRSTLVEAGQAASRSKGTYLSAQYHRLARRRGKKKAAVAVGHTILVIAYHILQRKLPYRELGGDYFDDRDREVVKEATVRRLERMGYKVHLEETAAA